MYSMGLVGTGNTTDLIENGRKLRIPSQVCNYISKPPSKVGRSYSYSAFRFGPTTPGSSATRKLAIKRGSTRSPTMSSKRPLVRERGYAYILHMLKTVRINPEPELRVS